MVIIVRLHPENAGEPPLLKEWWGLFWVFSRLQLARSPVPLRLQIKDCRREEWVNGLGGWDGTPLNQGISSVTPVIAVGTEGELFVSCYKKRRGK